MTWFITFGYVRSNHNVKILKISYITEHFGFPAFRETGVRVGKENGRTETKRDPTDVRGVPVVRVRSRRGPSARSPNRGGSDSSRGRKASRSDRRLTGRILVHGTKLIRNTRLTGPDLVLERSRGNLTVGVESYSSDQSSLVSVSVRMEASTACHPQRPPVGERVHEVPEPGVPSHP